MDQPQLATRHRPRTRIRQGLAWTAALAVGAMLACSAGIGDPTPDIVSLWGIWQGTVNPDASPGGQGYLVVLPDQSFRFLSSTGISEVAGTVALGGSSLGGSGTWYTRQAANSAVPVTLGGTIALTPGAVLNLTFSGAAGAMKCVLNRDQAANGAIQPAALAGTYTASAANNSGDLDETIVIAPDGQSFTGSNSANSFSGKLAQRQNLNAFDVSGQFLPTDPTEVPLKFTGIAYLKPATASGTKATFVLIADSASAGQTAVVSGIYTAQ